ncbi:uncharacterized protein FIBRA_03436 [Fibroporia radiculosa]|uniref:DUF155 domain-containing protein n=1 Tax=Fibroporia radiculosa TaxID=599839 RepID=J4GNH2_9APHY|nr:uncharacterized protein FIBRA_03436 [Fibroporia radiculosa]CCM01385.1 predicted protein [Fibroporia radiculosa]
MGRTRTKSRKATALLSKVAVEEPTLPPSVSALLEKSQSLIVQCDYDLARRFVQRALDREPSNAQAKEMLGVVQLETGELDAAKLTFTSLVPPHPSAPVPPPPSAHLYLAQLSDDPHAALKHYQAAVDVLTVQLKGKDRAVDSASTSDDDADVKHSIVRALIGMVEIWMDDLCFEPAAEKSCEDLLSLALQTDPGNTEALQALASVRLSQQRPDDAKACLEQAWTAWKSLDLDDSRLPPIPTRLSLVKMFLELSLYTPALFVLQGVMATDDQDVEAWYLEGWCFFLMAEQAQESGGKLDELTWQELAKDARDCLETCQMLHVNQEHPDKPLLEHVLELIAKLEALGIQPSPEGADEEENDSWEDAEGSDDEDAQRPASCLRYRCFAQSASKAPSEATQAIPKPKASTPLRRSASASLPIRSNPTPTRSDIQPVFTLATAERYLLPNLKDRLPSSAKLLHESWWIPRWTEDGRDGEIFIFGNGSFVCWGLGEDQARKFAQKVLAKSNAEVAPLLEPETEDLEFVTDPEETTRLQGDLIILGKSPAPTTDEALPGNLPHSLLPQENVLARYAFSQALSRSTALSALELSLEKYLSSVALLPDTLRRTGKPGLSRKALVMKLGQLLKFRQGINLNRENFSDTPDLYWAEPALENYFNSLSNALEMKARTRSVNDKITYAAEMQSVLRELLTETSGHRMELIIIALIAVEVIICLIRDGPELWHMVTGASDKSEENNSAVSAHERNS